jgi:hypothetical protein
VSKPVPSDHATTVPAPNRRLVVLALALVVMLHGVLVMIWVMPVNPFRDAVGQQRLSSYINPYFEQSWSVFAPTPRRGGENVRIRAYIGEPGAKNGTVTEWFDITTDEDARTKYLLNPSRFHSATRRLGGNINGAVGKFNAVQKRLVAASFVDTPRSELEKLIRANNTAGYGGLVNADDYLRNDEMLTRFGTMYATARWGDGITMVQFLVGRRTVPAYALRNKIELEDVPFQYYPVGWRSVIKGEAQAQAAFDDYVTRVPVKKSRASDADKEAGE